MRSRAARGVSSETVPYAILFKSAGAFQTTGKGNIVDMQVIIGVIQAGGQFDSLAGVGAAEYEGTICLP